MGSSINLSGKLWKLTVDEVILLANASSNDLSLVTLSDKFQGNTLLHLAAKFDLTHEAALLIANGANAATPNGNGQKPFQLAQDETLRDMLRKAAQA